MGSAVRDEKFDNLCVGTVKNTRGKIDDLNSAKIAVFFLSSFFLKKKGLYLTF